MDLNEFFDMDILNTPDGNEEWDNRDKLILGSWDMMRYDRYLDGTAVIQRANYWRIVKGNYQSYSEGDGIIYIQRMAKR